MSLGSINQPDRQGDVHMGVFYPILQYRLAKSQKKKKNCPVSRHRGLYNISDLDGISGPTTQIFILTNCAATQLIRNHK